MRNWRLSTDDIIDHICDLGVDHEDSIGGIVMASPGAVAFAGDNMLAQAYQAAGKFLHQSKAERCNRVSLKVPLSWTGALPLHHERDQKFQWSSAVAIQGFFYIPVVRSLTWTLTGPWPSGRCYRPSVPGQSVKSRLE